MADLDSDACALSLSPTQALAPKRPTQQHTRPRAASHPPRCPVGFDGGQPVLREPTDDGTSSQCPSLTDDQSNSNGQSTPLRSLQHSPSSLSIRSALGTATQYDSFPILLSQDAAVLKSQPVIQESDCELVDHQSPRDNRGIDPNSSSNINTHQTVALAPLKGYSLPGIDLSAKVGQTATGALLDFELRFSGKTPSAQPQKQPTARKTLWERLTATRCASPRRQKEHFYPIKSVENLINEDNLKAELGMLDPTPDQGIQQLSREIRGIQADGTIARTKSYRRIFAILVTIQRTDTILFFLEDGVSDEDLPLAKIEKDNRIITGFRRCSDKGGAPLKCFKEFRPHDLDCFEDKQWAMSAPVFQRPHKKKVKLDHLSDEAILPFVYEKKVSNGGFGIVYEGELHPEHHDFGAQNSFAIKRLVWDDKGKAKDEFDMLSKFSGDAHSNLISVQGAYTHRGSFYLIFPLAKSDLLKYWSEENLTPVFEETVCWVAEQCAGLAGGLSQIHRYESSSSPSEDCAHERPLSGGHQRSATPRKLCGRHGDIKPRNVLWFPDDPANAKKVGGTLKLTDFGLVEFHSQESCSNRTKSRLAASLDYRPPEFDMTDGKISRSFDIWTLGCLYLEFILWLMGGWPLVREFHYNKSTRYGNRRGETCDHAFFEFVESGSSGRTAKLKETVRQYIEKTHAQPTCPQYIHDFLDLVEKDMLLVETNDRSSERRIVCGTLHSKLKKMYHRCLNEDGYATKPAPRPRQ